MATIVIAEDEFLLADILQHMLEENGHVAMTAPHGLAALELIRAENPDLVITDFMMPLMTGLELSKAIRSDPKFANLPIILVSGAQGSIGRAHPEAFDAVLEKPYLDGALLAQIDRLLGRSGR
jgi:CheY-like chemotaxis protein